MFIQTKQPVQEHHWLATPRTIDTDVETRDAIA
jgi:hypothetical protein